MSALGDIMRLLQEPKNESYDRFIRQLRIAAKEWNDIAAPVDDARLFRAWAMELYRTHHRSYYQGHRLTQLRDGPLRLWVYRTEKAQHNPSCSAHQRFDGIAVPSTHKFWELFFPANGWHCTCAVYGTSSVRGVARLGGDPEKTLPSDWSTINDATGLPYGIEPGFAGMVHPTVADCLRALEEGHILLCT